MITTSLSATMAYLASDGLSSLTSDDMTGISLGQSWPTPIIGQPISKNLHKLVEEIRWEDKCERNALLTAPGIDFDIFELSEEDAFDSLIHRSKTAIHANDGDVGYEFFGYQHEFINLGDYSNEWLDEADSHGSWGNAPKHRRGELRQLCRDGDCDFECLY